MLCGTFLSRTSTTEVKVKLYYLSHTIVITLPLHHRALQLAGVFRAIFLANYTQNQNQSYNLSSYFTSINSYCIYYLYLDLGVGVTTLHWSHQSLFSLYM